jgi:hypothetical protein
MNKKGGMLLIGCPRTAAQASNRSLLERLKPGCLPLIS